MPTHKKKVDKKNKKSSLNLTLLTWMHMAYER